MILSTSIYDLVLLYVCHFHHHFLHLTVTQILYFSSFSLILSRYSCFYLGSQHPRILSFKMTVLKTPNFQNWFHGKSESQKIFLNFHTVHLTPSGVGDSQTMPTCPKSLIWISVMLFQIYLLEFQSLKCWKFLFVHDVPEHSVPF